jgi:hypothetical protein
MVNSRTDTNVTENHDFSAIFEAVPSTRHSSGGFLPIYKKINENSDTTNSFTLSISQKFIFNKNLKQRMTDIDVIELQKFLNTHGYPVSLSGPGSKGFETEKFGPLTKMAVIKFQKTNNIKPAYGLFWTVTRSIVNKISN